MSPVGLLRRDTAINLQRRSIATPDAYFSVSACPAVSRIRSTDETSTPVLSGQSYALGEGLLEALMANGSTNAVEAMAAEAKGNKGSAAEA
jgi:hypothetical protein